MKETGRRSSPDKKKRLAALAAATALGVGALALERSGKKHADEPIVHQSSTRTPRGESTRPVVHPRRETIPAHRTVADVLSETDAPAYVEAIHRVSELLADADTLEAYLIEQQLVPPSQATTMAEAMTTSLTMHVEHDDGSRSRQYFGQEAQPIELDWIVFKDNGNEVMRVSSSVNTEVGTTYVAMYMSGVQAETPQGSDWTHGFQRSQGRDRIHYTYCATGQRIDIKTIMRPLILEYTTP